MSLVRISIISCDRVPGSGPDGSQVQPAWVIVRADSGREVGAVDDRTQRNIRRAAEFIAKADALLITAGAGMGVDSGLPDFRGPEGFWRAYPALGKLEIPFEKMAQPQWFAERPEMAWAFYGQRQQLYRETKPHMGFSMLLDWGRVMPCGYFVVTSNVDGQFEKAGFPAERVLEQHGSIHRLQCSRPCSERIWLEEPGELDIDLETITARGRLPRCPGCGAVARPNVLMFADPDWLAKVRHEQEQRYRQWLASVRGRRLVVLEIGAGIAVPTVRRLGESMAAERVGALLVRINPLASETDDLTIPIRQGALEALLQIEAQLKGRLWSRAPVHEVPVTDVASPSRPKVFARGPERLPPTVATRAMEILEFDVTPVPEPGKPAWWLAAASPNDLRAVSLLDLATGQVQSFSPHGITAAELRACAESWYGAQQEFAPLPEVGGYVESGFSFRGRVIRSADAPEDERPGAALIFICGPGEKLVLTAGIVRQPSDGAFVWRLLYEQARVHLKPLEHPRAPWVAYAHEPAAEEHAAMLPVLVEVVKRLAFMWLTVQAYYKREGDDGEE